MGNVHVDSLPLASLYWKILEAPAVCWVPCQNS